MSRTHTPVDPMTQEVLEPEVAARRIEEVAARLVELDQLRKDLDRQMAPLVQQDTAAAGEQHQLRVEMHHLAPIGSRVVASDTHGVVILPPARKPSQVVNKLAAESYARDLVRLGVGEWVETYKPPTAAQVKAAAADIIAAGLPYAEILPEPPPGDPVVQVVEFAQHEEE